MDSTIAKSEIQKHRTNGDRQMQLIQRLLIVVLAWSSATVAGDQAVAEYNFPPAGQLPVQKGLPDPFLMYDGTRVKTREDWRRQRGYLKAMLAHYLYGRMPPKPGNVTVKKTPARQIDTR